jgi:fatty acid desaturase
MTAALQIVVFIGVCLTLYHIQLAERCDRITGRYHRHRILAHARRIIFVTIALTLLWCASYADGAQVLPWPPVVLLVALVDVLIVFRILVIRQNIAEWRCHETRGHRTGDSP